MLGVHWFDTTDYGLRFCVLSRTKSSPLVFFNHKDELSTTIRGIHRYSCQLLVACCGYGDATWTPRELWLFRLVFSFRSFLCWWRLLMGKKTWSKFRKDWPLQGCSWRTETSVGFKLFGCRMETNCWAEFLKWRQMNKCMRICELLLIASIN